MKHPVVAYVRVSTFHQDLDTQKMLIESWAKSNNVPIAEWLIEPDPISGSEDEREKFQYLWRRVKEKSVGTIVVSEISRLSRRQRTLINFLYDCFENGVEIVSLRESWLTEGLKNELIRPILIAMFSTLYELERKMISERTKAGIARAKAQGKRVGKRPKKLSKEKILQLLRAGVPKTRIAKQLGISRSTLYRHLKNMRIE